MDHTQDFSDIKVSTMTFTAATNVTINVEELFKVIEITPYVVYPKKRGRKKKGDVESLPPQVPFGSIIAVKYEGQMKGVNMKATKGGNWFRNAISVDIILDKPINFKVCKNGTFQMTGCKNKNHPKDCVKIICDIMARHPNTFTFTRKPDVFEALIIPSMRNIDFYLGFNVDREGLRTYLSQKKTQLHCLLEPSFGYTGVNIKIPLKTSRNEMEVVKITREDGEWSEVDTNYLEYLNTLTEKERTKKMEKQRYNTFLVFHSGKVIFSGLTHDMMRDTYYEFINTMKVAKESIMEKLKT